jgi:hypothetical protein
MYPLCATVYDRHYWIFLPDFIEPKQISSSSLVSSTFLIV